MLPEPSVWIFNAEGARFPGGAFTSLERAEAWIAQYQLTGILTAYPLDQGVLEWAEARGVVDQERLGAKRSAPAFIGGFTTASQEHYHYEDGARS